jgi:hypothetical protein
VAAQDLSPGPGRSDFSVEQEFDFQSPPRPAPA